MLQRRSFEVWGGDQLRDYTYVDDCINAMRLAAKSNTAVGEIYNLGGCGSPFSLLETAETLVSAARDIGLTIADPPFVVHEYPSERKKIDIGNYYANDNKITTHLGWKAEVPLREGLRRTLSYFSEELEFYA